jgi:hypothetical protein
LTRGIYDNDAGPKTGLRPVRTFSLRPESADINDVMAKNYISDQFFAIILYLRDENF